MNAPVLLSRNAWLDTLRGFAAAWVVIFHLNQVIPNQGHAYAVFAGLGYLGVPIFFVISGYCIWLSAERSTSRIEFYWRRFCRIYLPYLVSLLVVIGVIVIRKVITGNNDVVQLPSSLQGWLATLTLMTAPVSAVPTMNWVYWSLSYEVIFYILVGLTILKKNLGLLIIFFITGLSLLPRLVEDHHFLFFLNQWGLFVLGIGLHFLKSKRNRTGIALLFLSSISVILYTSFLVQIVGILTGISIWLSDRRESFLTRTNLLSQIGECSYGLYLLHVPIGCYLMLQLRQGIWLEWLPLHMLYDFGVLACCIRVSTLFFRFIEQPAISLSRSKIPLSFIQRRKSLP